MHVDPNTDKEVVKNLLHLDVQMRRTVFMRSIIWVCEGLLK